MGDSILLSASFAGGGGGGGREREREIRLSNTTIVS